MSWESLTKDQQQGDKEQKEVRLSISENKDEDSENKEYAHMTYLERLKHDGTIWESSGLFKHRFHWTEALMIFFTAFAAIAFLLWMAGADISTVVYTLVLTIVSCCALFFVWNFALVKSLAESNDQLKVLCEQQDEILIKSEEENEQLKKDNDAAKKNKEQFLKGIGLLDKTDEQLDAVEAKLLEVFDANEKRVKEEQELNEADKKLVQEQGKIDLYNESHKMFGYISRDGCIDSEREKSRMKDKLRKFLKKKKIEGVSIEDFDLDGDGKLYQWEFSKKLDHIIGSRLSRIEDVISENENLKGKLQNVKK